jgi:hypothetical protein
VDFLILAANGDGKEYGNYIQQAARDVGRIIGVIP